jgi:hypothetical protein
MGNFFKPRDYDNEGQLEDEVMSKDYETVEHPGICGAIVISSDPGGYRVKLRYDDNNYVDVSTGELKQLVPTTRLPVISTLMR